MWIISHQKDQGHPTSSFQLPLYHVAQASRDQGKHRIESHVTDSFLRKTAADSVTAEYTSLLSGGLSAHFGKPSNNYSH